MPVRLLLLTVTLSLLPGCASSPTRSYPTPAPSSLPAVSPDSAWHLVLGVVRDRRWGVAHTDRVGGLITTEWLAANDPDAWMDCGHAGLFRVDVGHQGKVTFALRPLSFQGETDPDSARGPEGLGRGSGGGGTVVDISVTWSVRRRGLDDVVRTESCRSRGTLERELNAALEDRAGS